MVKKIDIGCGKFCKEGFIGIDILNFGQKYVIDVRNGLPFKKNSIDEVYSRYFIPCLTNYNDKLERIKFFNEIYRVMKQNTIATIILPSWNSAGGYGNPLFHEQFYEGSLFFLDENWRKVNAPEVTQYTCDFFATWGYNMHPNIVTRNQEYQQFALANYCNSSLDIMITLTKK